ncbi:PHB depolymerase family esterase [Tardiphaga alba]|uniref:PHB depolymerase family esterase n=1 Tax=Tardiphaga alba TaxID=340268 RepID=A0ABX8AEF0_9BRAD|nr:PHB depolymerase family esterase [Tardiphaga alba]QUS42143.1 PHB depolymerase family esterase [Tardiphaga alba]
MSLADNIEFFRHLPKMAGGLNGMGRTELPVGDSPLEEVTDFGSNPGNLKMFAYAPEQLAPKPALVVVLHGCTQTAAGYDLGSGWSKLAQRYGFVLVMPEQTRANNSNTCFNWFAAEDISRDSGEALSIRQMVEHAAIAHGVDAKRIYVTGLSAGGAMASVMLATYPDVFAAGAIIAGLPYGIAQSTQEALAGMYRAPTRSMQELGDLVRKASPHQGPWPRVSVWHGAADRTVNPANAGEIVKQWLGLHGLPDAPMSAGDVDGYPREVWWNGTGETVVESYTITGMVHGTPLAIEGQEDAYGAATKFMLDAGIASSWHIAQFFGLTKQAPIRTAASEESRSRPSRPQQQRAEQDRRSKRRNPPGRRASDVSGVVTRALSAIGLIK